jgi:hypothetical protein
VLFRLSVVQAGCWSGRCDELATHGQLDALDGPLLQFVILGNGVGQPNQYGQQKGLNN